MTTKSENKLEDLLWDLVSHAEVDWADPFLCDAYICCPYCSRKFYFYYGSRDDSPWRRREAAECRLRKHLLREHLEEL